MFAPGTSSVLTSTSAPIFFTAVLLSDFDDRLQIQTTGVAKLIGKRYLTDRLQRLLLAIPPGQPLADQKPGNRAPLVVRPGSILDDDAGRAKQAKQGRTGCTKDLRAKALVGDGVSFEFTIGSGPGIRTLNLAVNRSLRPVQK